MTKHLSSAPLLSPKSETVDGGACGGGASDQAPFTCSTVPKSETVDGGAFGGGAFDQAPFICSTVPKSETVGGGASDQAPFICSAAKPKSETSGGGAFDQAPGLMQCEAGQGGGKVHGNMVGANISKNDFEVSRQVYRS